MRIFYLLIISTVQVLGQNLPAPENLQGQWLADSSIVYLEWDSLAEDNAGYHLFVQQPGQDKFFLWAVAGQIHENSYAFKAKSRFGGTYRFRVAAFKNFPQLIYGNQSDMLTIEIPSKQVPMVGGIKAEVKRNSLNLSWQYPNKIEDLAGYEIILNDSTIIVGKDPTVYNFKNLPSSNYSISIIAVSDSGVRSEASATKVVQVKK